MRAQLQNRFVIESPFVALIVNKGKTWDRQPALDAPTLMWRHPPYHKACIELLSRTWQFRVCRAVGS